MPPKPATISVTVRIDADAVREFDNLAREAGVDRSGYLQLWFGQFRRIKRGYALAALTSLPPEILKGLPGRPSDESAGKAT